MRHGFRLICSILVTTLLVPSAAAAAGAAGEVDEEASVHRLSVSAGLGIVTPVDFTEEEVGGGPGFYAAGEYSFQRRAWAQPKVYAGLLIGGASGDDCVYSPCDVSARIFFFGVKGRLLAPIPYVAPFIELGFGASIGSMTTLVGPYVNEQSNVLTSHIPVVLGLALGKDHDVELSFLALAHPAVRQANGALAIGLEFPLD